MQRVCLPRIYSVLMFLMRLGLRAVDERRTASLLVGCYAERPWEEQLGRCLSIPVSIDV